MTDNLIDDLVKKLNGENVYELRQLGRALGVPHSTDRIKNELIDEIIAIASAQKDSEMPTKRGAPAKSPNNYNRQLAAEVLRCREIFLEKTMPKRKKVEPHEICVANGAFVDLDFISGGILEFDGENWFLRTTGCKESCFSDVFVNNHFIVAYKLREGDYVEGRCKRKTVEEMAGLASIIKVNGIRPDTEERPEFDALTPIYANKRISVAVDGDKAGRMIDLLAPIGAGQRVLVTGPHGCGKSRILKKMAFAIEQNYQNVKLVIVLLDAGAEDSTDFGRSFTEADVFISPFEAGAQSHIRTMRLALEYCKRQTELCRDVVLVIDDLTRLVRAYNALERQISTLDYSAVISAKKVLGSARNAEQGGSLTVISAVSSGMGDSFNDTVYSEMRGICNVKITLSQALARSKVSPPIELSETYSAQDERLLTKEEMRASIALRNKSREEVFSLFSETDDNGQLIDILLK